MKLAVPALLVLTAVSPAFVSGESGAVRIDSADRAGDEASPEAAAIEPELLQLFEYDPELDLAIEEAGVDTFTGFDRIDLSYASPMADGLGGGRVPAYLYVPHADGPWAGMLSMHGMPGDRTNGAELAAGYARGGALVLAISAPWARVRPMAPITFTGQDRLNQIQLIQDLRRGLDLLLEFPEVDPERLGYVGGSYGGAMGGLLAGVESRIRAYALLVGDGGLVAHMRGPGDEVPPAGVSQERWDAWVDSMEPLEPSRFVAHAAPAELLFQNGRTDQLVPASDAEVYQAAGSEPKTVLWYDGGHSLTGQRLLDQARWMGERIGIDPSPFELGG